MSADPFHLAWFTPFKAPAWKSPWASDTALTWFNGDYYIDMAKQLERAGFDFMMFEDSTLVSNSYGGTTENDLKHALHAPKADPVPLLPLLAAATDHMGFIATMSTSFYPPFIVARVMATMDHLTRGRIGWNVVTSSEDLAGQNYGLDQLLQHDERYDMAEEFVTVVKNLWDSWEPGAIVADRETGYYADHTKVHEINHVGKYFKVRGPLNLPAGPQGHPVICQAGGSPKGRDFAAKHANVLLASTGSAEAMKEYRDDIRARAAAHGRNPDEVKVMFIIQPVLGETQADAEELFDRTYEMSQAQIETLLGIMSITMEIDFKQFDLDKPLPDDVQTNGHQSGLAGFRKAAGGRTIREALSARPGGVRLVGTPDSVAEQMDEVMEFVGGDGFLIRGEPVRTHSRRYIDEIASGLAPALRRRGLIRSDYDKSTFKANLASF
ncbi:FMNH2-dependent monooxygenase [Subtercola boreus]|uniref:FMNH2-dependent monooxygenase n=1 Tax=Subtercola boreus TaxID=120213 RepID=A0A3E0VJS1_9MICO|nr:NtaA/DmoA family FMN-dependent monooxygenase [Subtercola boreus]RFA09909.1 FMNH2-dependent monooxygenase [Subtercola boreus]TQL52956.1 FMN-dependent oxidoreductase (nitrilotriacetate monooxygenase family) [Subtercola boreus]